jgi:hypothetical protein
MRFAGRRMEVDDMRLAPAPPSAIVMFGPIVIRVDIVSCITYTFLSLAQQPLFETLKRSETDVGFVPRRASQGCGVDQAFLCGASPIVQLHSYTPGRTISRTILDGTE